VSIDACNSTFVAARAIVTPSHTDKGRNLETNGEPEITIMLLRVTYVGLQSALHAPYCTT
jgi:hypothetical protein